MLCWKQQLPYLMPQCYTAAAAAADGICLHLMYCYVQENIRSLHDNLMMLVDPWFTQQAVNCRIINNRPAAVEKCLNFQPIGLVGASPHATGAGRHQLAWGILPPPPPLVPPHSTPPPIKQ